MFIDFLTEVFQQNKAAEAVIWKGRTYNYSWLLDRIDHWQVVLRTERIQPGAVVILEADFSPNSVALFLSLVEQGCMIVPLASLVEAHKKEFIETAQGEVSIRIDETDNVDIVKLSNKADHEFYKRLRQEGRPGLVLFSSGSTGKSKAAVHDLSKLLKKFHTRRHNLRTLTFLLLDHIGGIDTLLYSLSNGSCVITIEDRSPDAVCEAIEKFNVEVLPVTPTFLNFLLLSEAYERHDLSSLKYITYGTEVMPEVTLKKCAEIFPNVTILQKYGTTEVGTLRSKSKSSDSLWVRIGGEGFQTRIVDGILHIKAESAMLGYLNAPSPFTDDGWFVTGDSVIQEGQYLQILGRKSEIINVGGEKVYPAEVENVIQEMEGIAEVTVYGEKNPIVGNIVCARVRVLRNEDPKQLVARIKKHCRERLESYKVPVKVAIVESKQHSSRFKKVRRNG
ncbi:MAG: long-chain fatty acid--CoA ligase [Candidatus Zixiibacteriota bacterium]|nr:MAG: long-chain fatty acid--CoA ligase [candidate division Zixibacteria bacterium]